MDEAKSINKSLSVLGQVINALSTGKAKHVPFRDSMLTHILRDSLGGNCKTTLVVAVSPHKYNRPETISSLRFGRTCKMVTNKASVNRVFSNDELMKRLAILEAKNEELQEMLKKKAFDAFQNSELPRQIEALQKQLEEMKYKLQQSEKENEDLDNIIKNLQHEKSELEDNATTDQEQIELLQNKINEFEKIIQRLENDLEKQKQKEEYMNNQQLLLTEKVKSMEIDNDERIQQINTLQNELNQLRQFKHDTQQKDIENMMKQEQINNEMITIKQQMEQQKLQYQQEINIKNNQQLTLQKELNETKTKNENLTLQTEKLQNENEDIQREKEEIEQEKIKIEQELQSKEKEFGKQIQQIQQSQSNEKAENDQQQIIHIEQELKLKEEVLSNQYKQKEEDTVAKLEKLQSEKYEKYENEFKHKQKNLEKEYQRKDEELKNKEEIMRNEMRQELTIKIKNEADQEFNKKMAESREQFASQLSGLQQALNKSHTIQNTIRSELDEERKKFQDLQKIDNNKSDKILSMEHERESLLSQIEQLKKQLSQNQNESRVIQADTTKLEQEHKEEIAHYEEEKEELLQEKEEINRLLDEERQKIDEIKAEFTRKEELFGKKEKQQIDLLNKEKQEKQAIKNKLSQHSQVLTQSHSLLAKQNKLLKQRESKIYNLVEKQSAYLDSMNHLREVQIGMDEDVAKRVELEEKAAEEKRRKELEEQARKDEEYVRSLLLHEQRKPAAKIKKNARSHSRINSSYRDVDINNINNNNNNNNNKHKPQQRAESDVEQMMQIANANSKSNLSQQIASVALAQQRDRLMGGKQKKSVLDLWIKSQMQLMCGQLPTLCKKYGIKLNKLDDMYGNHKPNYQPKIDQYHYLKYRAEHYDPKEFDTPGNDDMMITGKRHSKKLSKNNFNNNNPLLPDSGGDEKDVYDPYGHYQNDEKAKVAFKPQGFVAQPQSPIRKGINGNMNDGYHLGAGGGGDEEYVNGKKKKKGGLSLFGKRKSKGNLEKEDKKSKNKKKEKKSRKKRKSLKKKDKKSKKDQNDLQENMINGMDRGSSAPEQMEFEDAPPPVPYGQYLNGSDMQQFEKIVSPEDQNNKKPEYPSNPVELEEELNIDKYRYHKRKNNKSSNGHNGNNEHGSQSSNESLEYIADNNNNNNNNGNGVIIPSRSVSKATQKSSGTVVQHDITYSREISISMMNDNLHNGYHNNNNATQFSKQPSYSQQSIPPPPKQQFDAATESIQSGEMAGIIINSQFGTLHSLKNSSPTLRIQVNNQNINHSSIQRIKIKFSKNYIGLVSNMNKVNLSSPIEYGSIYTIDIPLILNENEGIMKSVMMNRFDDTAELVVDTNLFAIKCQIEIPIHLFFQQRGQLPRDQFLSLWKSIKSEMESKLPIEKARSSDMDHLKELLNIHKMFFIHHRNIPNKGNILYYSCKMYGQVLLIEISIAISGKGTVVVRSSDKYKSTLAVHCVQALIDSTV